MHRIDESSLYSARKKLILPDLVNDNLYSPSHGSKQQ